jgi:hypothetical protein
MYETQKLNEKIQVTLNFLTSTTLYLKPQPFTAPTNEDVPTRKNVIIMPNSRKRWRYHGNDFTKKGEENPVVEGVLGWDP